MNTNYTNTETLVTHELKKKLQIEKNVYVAARSSKLQIGTAEKIISRLQEHFKLTTPAEALAIIAVLLQQGGTARSCDGNMSTTLFDQEVKLADLRRILKQLSCNKAERKLARTLADQIHEISAIMELPGNLYLKIKKSYPDKDFNMQERAWLSDFQSDNENCPAELRILILETFRKSQPKSKKKN